MHTKKSKIFVHYICRYTFITKRKMIISSTGNYTQTQYTFIWTKAIIQGKLFQSKVQMQGKLFQRCTHLLYSSVLSLGGNVNTRRMSKPDIWSIFHIKNQWNIKVIENYYVNYQNHPNLMLLTSLDTKRTLIHLFLFTNSAQKELVWMCTQSIRNYD